MDDAAMQNFFGSTQEHSGNTEHGYILFYARNDSPTAGVLGGALKKVGSQLTHSLKLPARFQPLSL
jgi:hypothetical protein